MAENLVLQGEDGKTYGFPAGTTREKISEYFNKIGVRPTKRVSGEYGSAPAAQKKPIFAAEKSHGATPRARAEPSHVPGSGLPMEVPPIDPGTGRRQTPGRTMTEEETARYRTASLVAAGGLLGGMGGAAIAAPVQFTGPLATFGIQATARVLGGALGGGSGEILGQLYERATGVGPTTAGESVQRIGESAKDQAILEGLGVGVEGAFRLAAEGARAGGGRLYEALKKTDVYRKIVSLKAAAVTERNLLVSKGVNETAEEIANSFANPPVPGLLEIKGPGIITASEERVKKNVAIMYEGFKTALGERTIDASDVAHAIIDVESKTPRAKGLLSFFTKPDPEWAKLVKQAKQTLRVSVKEVERGPTTERTIIGQSAETGGPIYRMKETPQPPRRIVKEPADWTESAKAAVDARGTISQRIADLEKMPNPPKEYVEGLKRSLSILDAKLEGVAHEIGPGGPELLKAAKQYFGASREVQKQAMYRLMKNGGDVARALMDPGAPEGVSVLKALARETGDTTLVPSAQRAVIEKLINPRGKAVDMVRFNDRLASLGTTGEALFSDPRASRIISGLKEQAAALEHLETVPRVTGESTETILMKLLTHVVPSAIGYEVGRHVASAAGLEGGGGLYGGFAGAALGGAMTSRILDVSLRLAENPQANRLFLDALRISEKGGELSGRAITQAARAGRLIHRQKSLGATTEEMKKTLTELKQELGGSNATPGR